MAGLSLARSFRPRRRGAAIVFASGLAVLTAVHGVMAAASKGPDSVADTAEKVLDAVVNISTSQTVAGQRSVPMPQLPPGSPFEEFFEEFFKRRGESDQNRSRRVSSLGSGFVVDASGIIVTNNHVIADADEIFANFNDGSKLKADVVGRDTKTDLAVLRVKPEKPLVSVPFGDSEKLRVGDWVMAIGNPFGLGGSLTVGVVSARNRDINAGPYDNFIQTDAAINRGNSGGPLFNMQGEVVGVNTAIISPSGGSIGIGFAVPSKTVVAVIGQLREFGETRRGWIGVRIQQVDDQIAETLGLGKARGALVAGVTDNGPAAKAGIQSGDVIVRFDGRDIREMRDLPRAVADTAVGKASDIVVVRKGKEQNLKITLGRLEDGEKIEQAALQQKPSPGQPKQESATRKLLGAELAAMSADLRKKFKIKDTVKGIVIVAVEPNSALADAQVKAGDVIVDVQGEAIANPADLNKRFDALKKTGKKSALLLMSNAEGEQRFVPVTIP
jgi:serine protease Do